MKPEKRMRTAWKTVLTCTIEEKMKIMVSACLLGENCKYSGGNNLRPEPSPAGWSPAGASLPGWRRQPVSA